MCRRSGTTAVLLLFALVLLAGCVAVPPAGTVSDGGAVGDGPATDDGQVANDGQTTANDGSDTDDGAGDPPATTDFAFEEVATTAGFEYESLNIGAVNGNDGVYAADYDDDLDTDLLAIGGSGPVLFRNTGGAFEATDQLSNVTSDSQGALFFDYDADGSEDLLLLRRNDAPLLFENRDGEFVRTDAGLDREFVVPVTASAADYTGNGCPDLFVADYNDWVEERPLRWQSGLAEPGEDNGRPNVLYRGDCEGFERAEDAGIEGTHWSLATSFVDLNDDGLPDIHVANDYYNDTLYYNDGDGTFDRRVLPGETNRNGMSSRAVDVTGDGRLDLFVTNIYYPSSRYRELPDTTLRLFSDFTSNRLGARMQGNNLLVGTEDGLAYEGAERNLSRGGWGWGSALEDFESDGDVDVFHATQWEVRFGGGHPTFVRPMLFAQHGGEFRRVNASAVGLQEGDDRGVSAIDFDRSGSMDVAVSANLERYRLYRNAAEQGESLQVVVEAGDLDHTAIGARVEATADGDTQLRVNNVNADYQSQDTRTMHFGVGDAERIDELRVEWPDGTVRTFEDVPTGQRILVTPGGIQERRQYADAG